MDPNDAAAGGWVVTEDRVIFMVREAGQSQDLDGSGFQDHTVLEAWDLSGTITNIGAPVRSGDGIVVAGGHLFFAQDEADSGHDLNGDGDQLDRVAQSLDLTSMTTANLGLRVVDFRAEGNLVAMRVQESGQGQDLDGDGDLNDWVLFVHYPLTGTTVNLGIDVGDHFPQRSLIEMSGYLIAARGNEGGTHDWNGDGDTSDNILFVYNARTGVLTNTHEAMLSDSSTGGYPFVISGDTVLFSVSEAFQGQADLNGDGDITDRIVHSFRATPPSITNLGLALPEGVQHPFRASNTHCAFLVGENEQGHQDLNGDGILGDNVLHLLDLSTGIVSNLQERVFNPEDYVLSGRDLAWTVRERSGQDLNGDGDSMDSVLFSREGSTGLVTNHHLAVFEVPGLVGMRLGRGFVLFSASEAGQGQMSLNGDTDSNDLVFHTLSF
jgi:hypothetical protein